jgi:hypothetical protein
MSQIESASSCLMPFDLLECGLLACRDALAAWTTSIGKGAYVTVLLSMRCRGSYMPFPEYVMTSMTRERNHFGRTAKFQ